MTALAIDNDETTHDIRERAASSFVPVYVDLCRRGFDERGRLGAGLRPGAAILYSIIVSRQGSRADGRRLTSHEKLAGIERVGPSVSSAGLRKEFGWSHDELESWTAALEAPIPCPWCERRHPFVATLRSPGTAYRFVIESCTAYASEPRLTPADLVREKRPRSGALLDTVRDDAQPDEGIRVPHIPPPPAAHTIDLSTTQVQRFAALRALARLGNIGLGEPTLARVAQTSTATDGARLSQYLTSHAAWLHANRGALLTTSVVTEIVARVDRQHRSGDDPREVPETWAEGKVIELARVSGEIWSAPQARRFLVPVREAIVAAGLTDVDEHLALLLLDRRVSGRYGRPIARPLAALLAGIKPRGKRPGWLLCEATPQDKADTYAAAFARLSPVAQEGTRGLIARARAANGEPSHDALAGLGIVSAGMRAWAMATL